MEGGRGRGRALRDEFENGQPVQMSWKDGVGCRSCAQSLAYILCVQGEVQRFMTRRAGRQTIQIT